MNGNNPLISVLIPAYNHEKYVQQTIKSIINQTYQNIELLIVDDGSKDDTWEKIEELRSACEKRFARVFFKTKKNEGTCLTLNQLLENAEGKYVFLIASDDVAAPQLIEKEVEFLENHEDYALVVCDNGIIDEDSKVCYWDKNRANVYEKNEAKYLSFGNYLKQHFDFSPDKFGSYVQMRIGNHIPNGYLIRKSIFDKTGFFTPKAPLEDYFLMLQISKYAKMKYFDEVLYYYRWHGNNTIVANNQRIIEYDRKTRQYEDVLLEKINPSDTQFPLNILGEQCKLAISSPSRVKELVPQKKYFYFQYLKYRLLSKILFGKSCSVYKIKKEIYHSYVKAIRKYKKSLNCI